MSSVVFLGPRNALKSLAAGASPQIPLRSLQRFLDPTAGFTGPTFKGPISNGRKGKEEREGGARNTRAATDNVEAYY